ncbi:hypothetical protein F5876DRAFT_69493 [Lentinula aff. lateritia]|uniref:Uncharacterized protein n=1 Tax=Lentinula aff. lateritia TaxID=2804960 RepID=A0ACC1TMF3_9AGAR|nr:hypothetical protein F5876DRAFT_69493 [Lentinula aff. lateritia]
MGLMVGGSLTCVGEATRVGEVVRMFGLMGSRGMMVLSWGGTEMDRKCESMWLLPFDFCRSEIPVPGYALAFPGTLMLIVEGLVEVGAEVISAVVKMVEAKVVSAVSIVEASDLNGSEKVATKAEALSAGYAKRCRQW